MGCGFKDSGGTGYKDTSVGYKEALGGNRPAAGYGAGTGFKDSHETKTSGFGFKATYGGTSEKKVAPDATEMRRMAEQALRAERMAEEKRLSQKNFDNRKSEQHRFEQKQHEQRLFEDRQRQERDRQS